MAKAHQRVRKAVIPAAGLGTRFLPASKAVPKEMLPIVDKPILQYIVEEAAASGIEQVILVTGRQKTAMEDHFDVSYELEDTLQKRNKPQLLELCRQLRELVEVVTVRQHEPLGLGHAILCAKGAVGDEPFAVMLPDDLVDGEGKPGLKQLLDVYDERGEAVVGLIEVPPHQLSWYGIVKHEPVRKNLYRVWDMIEKPKPEQAHSNLGIVARYVFPPEIFPAIEETRPGWGGEIQITDAIRKLASERAVYGWVFQGMRFDAGDKFGYLEATLHYALKHPELGERFRLLLQERARSLSGGKAG